MTTTHVPHQRQSGRLAADVGAAIIELVVYAGLLAIGSCLSVFLGFLSDGCNEPGDCNSNLIGLGFVLAFIGTWVPFVASVAAVIAQGARGRTMWWIPWVGVVLSVGIFVGGVAMAAAGGPQH